MPPSRSGRSRRAVTYDPELPIDWTLKRLREELQSLGINPPTNSRRMALVRLLTDARITDRSKTASRDSDEVATDQVSASNNNGRDRAMIDIVSRLSNTVHVLQQSVNNLSSKVSTLDSRVSNLNSVTTENPDNSFNQTQRPELVSFPINTNPSTSSEEARIGNFSISSALQQQMNPQLIPTSNRPTCISAAAGSQEQLQMNTGPNTVTRGRFGISMESLPAVDAVSPQLRQQIIQGRDVNLASLLIPYFSGPFHDSLEQAPYNTCQTQKPDNRLNRNLSLGEFIQAFGIYKSVMCSAFPQRRQELDLYERDIVDMATRYPGKAFYEYHKQFSLTAAAHLRYNNILVDWSIRNKSLFCNIFANSKAASCTICNSTLHTTGFCPSSKDVDRVEKTRPISQSDKETDTYGRKRMFFLGKEICNNFNGERGCKLFRCNNSHICLDCKGDHSRLSCQNTKNGTTSQDKALVLRNIPLSAKKTVGPSTSIEYLGIILDSENMEARLPQDKLNRILSIIRQFSSKRTCTKRELLSLLGHLNFASRVVVPGRSFVSHLIAMSTNVKKLHHHVHLNKECRADLAMWAVFLEGWNGISFFLDDNITRAADIELFTDATPTSFGGIYNNQWFQGYFPISLQEEQMSMAFCELYPIVMACILWGSAWKRKRILFHCDNLATVEIIRKGRSNIPSIMKLMRSLTFQSAKCNFIIHAKHIPGVRNDIADALSRFQMDRFRRLAPQAEKDPTPCVSVKDILMD
ncbi:hypothetical protein FSP39_001635 [Pinctada imbricata]|uniref:Uncharacterized protein n=1 Tax=Pinctada imbricata TaxID=66713 RepID=A0AA88YGX8_PINIB|nr:hypothetical protein FSP39_001635 [Pinctada imbricata]